MNPALPSNLRSRLGCWLHERWRTELVLRMPYLARQLGLEWTDLCNRNEVLSPDVTTGGRICEWSMSSTLTVSRVFPKVGERLLRYCDREWPVGFGSRSRELPGSSSPDVSFIIGIRGQDRLPQFSACIDSLLAQSHGAVEVVVVEQSREREIEDRLHEGVRYVHQPVPETGLCYNRSWALNRGACEAEGRILVLMDADMLMPSGSAKAIVEVIDRGVAAVRLPRMIFYLDKESSLNVQEARSLQVPLAIEKIVANCRVPVAVRRDTYYAIGGHDESFAGWGGEDDEFMSRLRTQEIAEGCFLPIIHLWHESAAYGPSRSRNATLLETRVREPVEARMKRLRRQGFGLAQPSVNRPN